MRPNPQESADLVAFTEEIPNGKLHFLRSVTNIKRQNVSSITAQKMKLSIKDFFTKFEQIHSFQIFRFCESHISLSKEALIKTLIKKARYIIISKFKT